MKVYHAENYQIKFLRTASCAAIFAAVGSFVFSLFFLLSAVPEAEVEMHFLDVGQGDGFYLQTAGGASLLIDFGPPAGTFKESLSDSVNIFDKNIDLLMASHPDADHIGGLKWVMDRFRYGMYLDSFVTGTSKLFEEIEKRVEEDSTPPAIPKRLHAYEGMKITITDRDKKGMPTGTPVEMEVLAPSFRYIAEKILQCKKKADIRIAKKNEIRKSSRSKVKTKQAVADYGICFPDDLMETNEMSVVMHIRHGKNSVMMTGDAPVEIERYIIEQSKIVGRNINLKSRILKAGHHGSKTSTASDFVQAVSPEFAIISSGASNKYGHPNQAVIQTLEKFGAKIIRTDELGTIVFRSSGSTLLNDDNKISPLMEGDTH